MTYLVYSCTSVYFMYRSVASVFVLPCCIVYIKVKQILKLHLVLQVYCIRCIQYTWSTSMYLSHYIGVLNILIHIPDTLNKVIVFHRVGTLVYYVNTVCVPWCFYSVLLCFLGTLVDLIHSGVSLHSRGRYTECMHLPYTCTHYSNVCSKWLLILYWFSTLYKPKYLG